MPSKGFSPFASARRRFSRSSSLTVFGRYPALRNAPSVAGRLSSVCTVGILETFPARLTAGVARLSAWFEIGDLVFRPEHGRPLPSGAFRGEPAELFELLLLKPDHR